MSIGINGICDLVVAALIQSVQFRNTVDLHDLIENSGKTCLKDIEKVTLIWYK